MRPTVQTKLNLSYSPDLYLRRGKKKSRGGKMALYSWLSVHGIAWNRLVKRAACHRTRTEVFPGRHQRCIGGMMGANTTVSSAAQDSLLLWRSSRSSAATNGLAAHQYSHWATLTSNRSRASDDKKVSKWCVNLNLRASLLKIVFF